MRWRCLYKAIIRPRVYPPDLITSSAQNFRSHTLNASFQPCPPSLSHHCSRKRARRVGKHRPRCQWRHRPRSRKFTSPSYVANFKSTPTPPETVPHVIPLNKTPPSSAPKTNNLAKQVPAVVPSAQETSTSHLAWPRNWLNSVLFLRLSPVKLSV